MQRGGKVIKQSKDLNGKTNEMHRSHLGRSMCRRGPSPVCPRPCTSRLLFGIHIYFHSKQTDIKMYWKHRNANIKQENWQRKKKTVNGTEHEIIQWASSCMLSRGCCRASRCPPRVCAHHGVKSTRMRRLRLDCRSLGLSNFWRMWFTRGIWLTAERRVVLAHSAAWFFFHSFEASFSIRADCFDRSVSYLRCVKFRRDLFLLYAAYRESWHKK